MKHFCSFDFCFGLFWILFSVLLTGCSGFVFAVVSTANTESKDRFALDPELSEVLFEAWSTSECCLACSTNCSEVCLSNFCLLCLFIFICPQSSYLFSIFYSFLFLQLYCPFGFLKWEIRVAFFGESQLRQSRATQPRYMLGVLVPWNSDMEYEIYNVRTKSNACDCTRGCTATSRRVCAEC